VCVAGDPHPPILKTAGKAVHASSCRSLEDRTERLT